MINSIKEITKDNLAFFAKEILDTLNEMYDKEPQMLEDMGFSKVSDALETIKDSYYKKNK